MNWKRLAQESPASRGQTAEQDARDADRGDGHQGNPSSSADWSLEALPVRADQRQGQDEDKGREEPPHQQTDGADCEVEVNAQADEHEYQGALHRLSSKSLSGERGISVIGIPVASSIAEAITAPTGITPASPAPFTPSGLSGDGVSMWSISMGGISVAYGIRNSMKDALRSWPSESYASRS